MPVRTAAKSPSLGGVLQLLLTDALSSDSEQYSGISEDPRYRARGAQRNASTACACQ
jgi:hypothetical protein